MLFNNKNNKNSENKILFKVILNNNCKNQLKSNHFNKKIKKMILLIKLNKSIFNKISTKNSKILIINNNMILKIIVDKIILMINFNVKIY